jgi:hypothetical protein
MFGSITNSNSNSNSNTNPSTIATTTSSRSSTSNPNSNPNSNTNSSTIAYSTPNINSSRSSNSSTIANSTPKSSTIANSNTNLNTNPTSNPTPNSNPNLNNNTQDSILEKFKKNFEDIKTNFANSLEDIKSQKEKLNDNLVEFTGKFDSKITEVNKSVTNLNNSFITLNNLSTMKTNVITYFKKFEDVTNLANTYETNYNNLRITYVKNLDTFTYNEKERIDNLTNFVGTQIRTVKNNINIENIDKIKINQNLSILIKNMNDYRDNYIGTDWYNKMYPNDSMRSKFDSKNVYIKYGKFRFNLKMKIIELSLVKIQRSKNNLNQKTLNQISTPPPTTNSSKIEALNLIGNNLKKINDLIKLCNNIISDQLGNETSNNKLIKKNKKGFIISDLTKKGEIDQLTTKIGEISTLYDSMKNKLKELKTNLKTKITEDLSVFKDEVDNMYYQLIACIKTAINSFNLPAIKERYKAKHNIPVPNLNSLTINVGTFSSKFTEQKNSDNTAIDEITTKIISGIDGLLVLNDTPKSPANLQANTTQVAAKAAANAKAAGVQAAPTGLSTNISTLKQGDKITWRSGAKGKNGLGNPMSGKFDSYNSATSIISIDNAQRNNKSGTPFHANIEFPTNAKARKMRNFRDKNGNPIGEISY